MKDRYADLRQASPEELFQAGRMYYDIPGNEDFIRGMDYAKKLLSPEGWKHVAPAWLDEIRRDKNA